MAVLAAAVHLIFQVEPEDRGTRLAHHHRKVLAAGREVLMAQLMVLLVVALVATESVAEVGALGSSEDLLVTIAVLAMVSNTCELLTALYMLPSRKIELPTVESAAASR